MAEYLYIETFTDADQRIRKTTTKIEEIRLNRITENLGYFYLVPSHRTIWKIPFTDIKNPYTTNGTIYDLLKDDLKKNPKKLYEKYDHEITIQNYGKKHIDDFEF